MSTLQACSTRVGLDGVFRSSISRDHVLGRCLDWFLLRGHSPTIQMASTLMSIVRLCLQRYKFAFASDAVSWIVGPGSRDNYIKVPWWGSGQGIDSLQHLVVLAEARVISWGVDFGDSVFLIVFCTRSWCCTNICFIYLLGFSLCCVFSAVRW